MVRYSYHITVTLGRFNDALKWAAKMNDDSRKNGWAAARLTTPYTGTTNALTMEWEYPDIATMDQERDAFFSNAEAMATFRAGIELVQPGTNTWDEIEQEVEQTFQLA